MQKKSLAVFLTALVAVVILSSCRAVINSPADELKTNKWVAYNDSSLKSSLYFEESIAHFLSVTDKEYGCDISGNCIVSDSGFVISDPSLGQVFTFTYEIKGQTLILTYDEIILEMIKDTPTSD